MKLALEAYAFMFVLIILLSEINISECGRGGGRGGGRSGSSGSSSSSSSSSLRELWLAILTSSEPHERV